MFNTIIITVKTLLRRPSTWVWGALFPVALSTMFMFMFANLSSCLLYTSDAADE